MDQIAEVINWNDGFEWYDVRGLFKFNGYSYDSEICRFLIDSRKVSLKVVLFRNVNKKTLILIEYELFSY